jgi:hypothetical protein
MMSARPTEKRATKKGEPVRSGQSKFDSRSTPKPSAFVLGDELEYRIARLHIFMGYFVRRGCPIYTVAALDRATDLDMLAIRYIEPFKPQMIIAECKSGDNAPLDRIFWLSGVKTFTDADEAVLVRKSTKWNIKDFAKECGVRVLDLQRLAELEGSLGINENEWPGMSDREFFEKEFAKWNDQIKNNARYWELLITLTSEVRWEEPFAGANYLLSQLRLLTRSFPQPPQESFYRFLLSECLAQVSIFILRIVEQSFDLSEKDRHGFIRKGLSYGNLNPKYAERILESAYNLARQSVFHYTNRTVDIDRQVFSMPEPPGTNELVALIDTLVRSYPASLIFPQVCDYLLLERFTKHKETRRVLRRIFPQSTLGITISLVQKFVSALVSSGACPSYIEDVFVRPEGEGTPAPNQPPASLGPAGSTLQKTEEPPLQTTLGLRGEVNPGESSSTATILPSDPVAPLGQSSPIASEARSKPEGAANEDSSDDHSSG